MNDWIKVYGLPRTGTNYVEGLLITNFEYIAFEIDKDYFEAAEKRIRAVTSQQELFVPEAQK